MCYSGDSWAHESSGMASSASSHSASYFNMRPMNPTENNGWMQGQASAANAGVNNTMAESGTVGDYKAGNHFLELNNTNSNVILPSLVDYYQGTDHSQ